MPEVGDIYRVKVEWTLPEQVNAYNQFGVVVTNSTCSNEELLDGIEEWLESAYSELEDSLNVDVTVVSAYVTKVQWSVDHWEVESIIGTRILGIDGTDSTDMLPHAVAAVVTFPTTVPKRRGRVFIPGLADNKVTNSLLTGPTATAIALFAAELIGQFPCTTATAAYYVLGDDGTYTYPASTRVNGVVGSQRRRKPGVGI